MIKYDKSIFIFRRELRLNDNTALLNALSNSNIVIPIFILTPEQLVKNNYKSDNCIQFMMESLLNLNSELKKNKSRLFLFFGKPDEVIEKIIKKTKADAVYLNRDYTPYSKKRDNKIQKVCVNNNVSFEIYEDYTLHNVGTVRTGDGNVYVKFTPFYNNIKKLPVPKPKQNIYSNYYSSRNKILGEFKGKLSKFYKNNDKILVHGGRDNGLKILKNINSHKQYNINRNFLSKPTTRLSAYIKFGCISIREVYDVFKKKLGSRNDLLKQLYWREFYYNVAEFYPDTLLKDYDGKNLKEKYSKVPWATYKTFDKKEKEYWEAWTNGETGIPVVDACMREMNTTGFMHNRGRMIVASLLVKNMFIHFAEGEKYFAQTLCDYDPMNNIGGWGWVSGSHADTQPYFRIFNPWRQSEKYDPDCTYIKKWVPELKDVENKHIHQWYKWWEEYDVDYPEPIIDYKSSSQEALKKYKKAFS